MVVACVGSCRLSPACFVSLLIVAVCCVPLCGVSPAVWWLLVSVLLFYPQHALFLIVVVPVVGVLVVVNILCS